MTTLKQRAIATECAQFVTRVQKHFNSKVPDDVMKQLTLLQSQLAQFLQSWSVMAGRNMLSDMVRTLVTLESKLTTGDGRTAVADLKKGLGRHLAGHNVTKARYDSALCFGYKIKTGGASYKGKSDDYADMQAKCRDMIAAIQSAHQLCSTAARNDGRMLKIFMAPEFFFRGKNGGYDFDDVMGLAARKGTGGVGAAPAQQGLLEIMQAEISKPIYKDWLFVLGTVIALSANTEHTCDTCKTGKGGLQEKVIGGVKKLVCKVNNAHPIGHQALDAHVDNIAYVCKETEVYTVSKELVSHIDYVMAPGKKNKVAVRGVELDVEQHAQKSGYNAASKGPTKFQDERMGGSIFTLDGVTFGLEVCLDHAAGTAKKSSGRLDHAGNIQINLIPSAGMNITNFRTVQNGVVFNVDGALPHVQVVGERNGAIWAIESRPKGKTTAVGLNAWVPDVMGVLLDLDSVEHRRGQSHWQKIPEASAPAPRGKVVAFGPFAIPGV